MQRLYRESHYANGTIESGEREPVSISVQEGTSGERGGRGEMARAKREERRHDSGAENVAENALLIISPKGEELIPRKKPQPNYSSRSSPDARWTTLRRSDFIGPSYLQC